MALVAFFAARHIVLKSKHGDEHGSHLPNPQQLTLLISVLGGSGFGPLKDTLLHRYHRKEKLIAPLPAAFSALFIITLLGLIIPIIDSWFGIATKAEIVTQLVPKHANLSSSGRGISPSICLNGPRDNGSSNFYKTVPENAWWPCNSLQPTPHGPIMLGLGEATRAIYGTSLSNQVLNYTDLQGRDYLYLGDPTQDATEDFQATTIATTSQCVPMTQLCYFNYDGANEGQLFNCTRAFSGNIFSSSLNTSAEAIDYLYSGINVGMAFSKNPQLTEAGGQFFQSSLGLGYPEPVDMNSGFNITQIYPTNPLHYGAWGAGYPAGDLSTSSDNTPNFTGDTGIYFDSMLGGRWVFNCSTTVWNVNYTWVNGAVQDFNVTLASPDLGGMLSSSLAWAGYQPQVQNAIAGAASIAGNTGNNSRTIATTFAQEISRTMLAFSLSAMQPTRNILEQDRIAGLNLARIPLVPLYLLVATKAIYVLAVIVLAIGAYCFTHPAETEVVKAQSSVKGLAAAHFNQPGLLQQGVVKQIQSRLDAVHGETANVDAEAREAGADIAFEKRGLRHAATAPVHGTMAPPPQDAKVGLLPTADGSWEFVLLANGVWNSIKPVVKSLVIQDANEGGLGDVGQVIKAWH